MSITEGRGGLNLSLLYSTLLDYVGDHDGIQTLEQGIEAIRGPLANQFPRVERLYGQGGNAAVAAWISDALALLVGRGILEATAEGWRPGPGFKRDEPMVVVTGRNGSAGTAITHTVVSPAEREHLAELDRRREAIGHWANELKEDGRGLRPLDEGHVEALMRSVQEFGLRDDLHPVLVDQSGRVLSGRHRLEVAKRLGTVWRRRVIKVNSDDEALAVAWVANSDKAWAQTDRARLAKWGIVPEQTLSQRVKQELIQQQLRADARRSNSEIGRFVGVDHKTVAAVRRPLEETGEIPRFRAKGGRGRTGAEAAAPKTEPPTERVAAPDWWPRRADGLQDRPAINPNAKTTVRLWIEKGIRREYGEAIKAEIDAAIAEGVW